MFTLIESKDEISRAQQRLEATIRRNFDKKVVRNIGYPGGTTPNAEVATNGIYWYWSSDYDHASIPHPRRLNWFGLFKDDDDLLLSVVINTAYEGRNDHVAGFFARNNDTGMIHLLHSGRVGGGTKGVSKSTFLAWTDQRLVDVFDSSGRIKDGVLVMPIDGIAATHSVGRYINEIARFKQAVRNGSLTSPEFHRKKMEYDAFYAESRGRRQGRRSEQIDYLSRHGDIVDAIHGWRNSRLLPENGKLVKNVLIDMGVAIGDQLVEIYEIKTSAARSNIYAAIGQLMVHGIADGCRKVLVLPQGDHIAPDLQEAITRLGIELQQFRIDNEAVIVV